MIQCNPRQGKVIFRDQRAGEERRVTLTGPRKILSLSLARPEPSLAEGNASGGEIILRLDVSFAVWRRNSGVGGFDHVSEQFTPSAWKYLSSSQTKVRAGRCYGEKLWRALAGSPKKGTTYIMMNQELFPPPSNDKLR